MTDHDLSTDEPLLTRDELLREAARAELCANATYPGDFARRLIATALRAPDISPPRPK